MSNQQKRQKTQSGQYRSKRGDTRMGSVEKKYNVDFGVRSDMKLQTYLKKEGLGSLSKALNDLEPKPQKRKSR